MTGFEVILLISICILGFMVYRSYTAVNKVSQNAQTNASSDIQEMLLKSAQNSASINQQLTQSLLDIKDQVNALQLRKTEEDSSSNIKGMLGNVLLEQMLSEIYGTNTKGILWDTEYTIEGLGRPDGVVLYKEKIIPIDSKNHKDDYVAYLEGTSNIKNMTMTLAKSVKDVAKYVDPNKNTSSMVILFLPSEQMYYDIFIKNFENINVQNLRRECRKHNVTICSPSTLYVELVRIMEQLQQDIIYGNLSAVMEAFRSSEDIIDRNMTQLDAWETRFKNVLNEIQTLRNANSKTLKKVKSLDMDKAT